jgi:hypothetical protein
VTIAHADCRSWLRSLEAESAHCVVTSPPYWGLRKYDGVEPTVWGGEEECEHEWGEETICTDTSNWAGFDDYVTDGHSPMGRGKKQTPTSVSQGSACLRCGAWRGCLGNEPTADCGRPMLRLRRDLTEKERQFVLQRLRELGLI